MHSSEPEFWMEPGCPDFTPIRLDDETYGRSLQRLVNVCTDACIIDSESKSLWLATRRSRPAQGWRWYIGGNCPAWKQPRPSMRDTFRRETGLDIAEERFVFRKMIHYHFSDRAQRPETLPCASLCYTYSVELTRHEIRRVRLDPQEYEGGGLNKFSLEQLRKDPMVKDPIISLYHTIFG